MWSNVRKRWICPGSSVLQASCSSVDNCVKPTDPTPTAITSVISVSPPEPTAHLGKCLPDSVGGRIVLQRGIDLSTHYVACDYQIIVPGGPNLPHFKALVFDHHDVLSTTYDHPRVSPDGNYVVYEGDDGKLWIHGAKSKKRVVAAPKPPIGVVTWDFANGKLLLDNGQDPTVALLP
jgi:hypothetical protein